MRTMVATVMAVSLVAGTLSMASAAEDKPTPQQEKMKACNTQAADKKGDERKAFMSSCLKAGAKKGDERKAFMSECMKADKKS